MRLPAQTFSLPAFGSTLASPLALLITSKASMRTAAPATAAPFGSRTDTLSVPLP